MTSDGAIKKENELDFYDNEVKGGDVDRPIKKLRSGSIISGGTSIVVGGSNNNSVSGGDSNNKNKKKKKYYKYDK